MAKFGKKHARSEMKKCIAGGKSPKECMKMMAKGSGMRMAPGGKGKG